MSLQVPNSNAVNTLEGMIAMPKQVPSRWIPRLSFLVSLSLVHAVNILLADTKPEKFLAVTEFWDDGIETNIS